MHPNKLFYWTQVVVILACIMSALWVGWALAQPLALMSLMALQYLPTPTLVPSPEMQRAQYDAMLAHDAMEGAQDSGYDGGGAGFVKH
jgi:hypothetical protein